MVLTRDGLVMILDGINKILEVTELETKEYDILKIVTEQTEGRSGFYWKITQENNKNNPNYEALIDSLKANSGKLTKQGYFAWLFDDGKTAGMKQNRK